MRAPQERVQGLVWTVSATQPVTTQARVKAAALARKERPMAGRPSPRLADRWSDNRDSANMLYIIDHIGFACSAMLCCH